MNTKFPFCYEISSGVLAANTGTSQVTQVFSSRSDFLLRTIRATGGSGVKVSIQEVGGNSYTNNAITTALIGNSSNNGITLLDNVIIPKGTQIQFSFANTGVQQTEVIQLWGIEVE